MKRFVHWKTGLCGALALGGVVWLVAGVASCGTAPLPFPVNGPGITGNDPPTLTFLEPILDVTRDRGSPFLIRWTDTDRDSNAQISFSLVNIATQEEFLLVAGIDENDLTGPDSNTAPTSLIPIGDYNLLGRIADSTNPTVSVFATTVGQAVAQPVVVSIVEPGTGPPTRPPIVVLIQPAFPLSVAQDDVLRVEVQPTEAPPDQNVPFDADSNITLYILLDRDLDPNNDDPANPDPNEIIRLREQTVQMGSFDMIPFDIQIDLAEVPPRPSGEPYFIRATANDLTNVPVHSYAVGTISVVQLAAGTVDLADIGKIKAGARFYGFSPGANAGSSFSHVADFDADGIDDFVVVAQFGNPRNFGPMGEAYLIYGQDQRRFGGALALNSVSEAIAGVIFEGPPIRQEPDIYVIPGEARSDGISDVSFIRDLTGDGRPELLFGLPHVTGAFESQDFDPGDTKVDPSQSTVGVEMTIQQGNVELTIDDTEFPANPLYFGVDDLTIKEQSPTTSFGSSPDLTWVDDGADQREWTLIKFSNLLTQMQDSAMTIDISTVEATLDLRVFDVGTGANLFVALTDFDEQTTFGTFAAGGGDPIAGIDYDEGGGQGLGSIDATESGTVSIDVTEYFKALIDGVLAPSNELRFIIVPSAEEETPDRTGVRSTEYTIADDRPTLSINYTQLGSGGSTGCYPDEWVNNHSDDDPEPDLVWYGGGMVVMLNSENRDNDPPIALATRLESTVVTLELVGQESWVLDRVEVNERGGGIFVRAHDPEEAGRLAGARFVPGWYDARDHLRLLQPPRDGSFGQDVATIGDLNNDGFDELIISSPRNERYREDLFATYGFLSTHLWSTGFSGSVTVIPGEDYNTPFWREDRDSTSSIPLMVDGHRLGPPFGNCTVDTRRKGPLVPADSFEVFAEDVDDWLGGAQSAGDFNQDGLDDILCGAPRNDRPGVADDSGAVYVLYGRNVLGDFDLTKADDPSLRTPMLRVRGVRTGDRIGWRQTTGLDVNGDRIDDVFIASPWTDYGGVARSICAVDRNRDGSIDTDDLGTSAFSNCRSDFGDEVFSDDACKAFDYDNNGKINDEDETIFDCLADGGVDCCDDAIENGFVGIIFGGVFTDGDRDITQVATSDLPGTVFFGSASGHLAGFDVSSAGDFNQDGFGDILIAVPGETRVDTAGRERVGVVYLVFGGTHLHNTTWSLAQVGTEDLPGIVFLSPYVKGRPNEAAPTSVGFLGDINSDGFGDIAIGNPKADFIDLTFPQGPDAPGDDPSVGRRSNAGDVYVIYGNNFGTNRGTP